MKVFENFISYRRDDSSVEAKVIYDGLERLGYLTFCDVYTMEKGILHNNIKKAIDLCTNFILILKTNTLLRCSEENDWLTIEITEALAKKKNIICVFIDDFVFPNKLPKEIEKIRFCSGLKFDLIYFDGFMEKLVRQFLVSNSSSIKSDDKKDFIINDNTLVKYIGSAIHVKVPDGIVCIGADAFKDKTKITTVLLPDSIIEIGKGAFERCIGLSDIKLPIDLKTIDERAFFRCYNLLYIAFNEKISRIEREAFAFCNKLKYVQLGSSVEYVDSTAFNNCDKLESIWVAEDNDFYRTEEGILYNKSRTELIRCPENYAYEIVNVPQSVKILKACSFSRCINLLDIVLPMGLREVEEFTFRDCINILGLTLGDEIERFDVSALEGWGNHQKVIVSRKFNAKIKYYIEQKLYEKPLVDLSDMTSELIIVKTTFESNEEASKMAKMLLDKRLVVAAQINKLNVFYSWNDELCNEDELELSCITKRKLYEKVEAFIEGHHSYNLCQIICIPISQSSEKFLQWVLESTE